MIILPASFTQALVMTSGLVSSPRTKSMKSGNGFCSVHCEQSIIAVPLDCSSPIRHRISSAVSAPLFPKIQRCPFISNPNNPFLRGLTEFPKRVRIWPTANDGGPYPPTQKAPPQHRQPVEVET